MADNVGYTPGSGATIAADDVGGVLYQRVKLTAGAENSATDISDAFPLPVSDAVAEESRQDLINLMTRVLNYLNAPQGYDKSLQRGRVTAVLESGTVTTVSTVTTCTTVTTVSTVTGLTNIDGRNGSMLINQTNLSAWADCVRARIT